MVPGGHIEYLSEMRGSKVEPMLNSLRETFERLADLQDKLKSLQKTVGVTHTTASRQSLICSRKLTTRAAYAMHGA